MLRKRFRWPVYYRRMVLPPLPWIGADNEDALRRLVAMQWA